MTDKTVRGMRTASCWNFLNPCLNVIMCVRGDIQIDAEREGEITRERKKEAHST